MLKFWQIIKVQHVQTKCVLHGVILMIVQSQSSKDWNDNITMYKQYLWSIIHNSKILSCLISLTTVSVEISWYDSQWACFNPEFQHVQHLDICLTLGGVVMRTWRHLRWRKNTKIDLLKMISTRLDWRYWLPIFLIMWIRMPDNCRYYLEQTVKT